ncbi:unnamed protein product, partial [Clonostachys chloroleuca]
MARRAIDAPYTAGTEATLFSRVCRRPFYRHGAELEYQVKKAGEQEFKSATRAALLRRYEYIAHIDRCSLTYGHIKPHSALDLLVRDK